MPIVHADVVVLKSLRLLPSPCVAAILFIECKQCGCGLRHYVCRIYSSLVASAFYTLREGIKFKLVLCVYSLEQIIVFLFWKKKLFPKIFKYLNLKSRIFTSLHDINCDIYHHIYYHYLPWYSLAKIRSNHSSIFHTLIQHPPNV